MGRADHWHVIEDDHVYWRMFTKREAAKAAVECVRHARDWDSTEAAPAYRRRWHKTDPTTWLGISRNGYETTISINPCVKGCQI